MVNTRYKKVIRDTTTDLIKNATLILAISIGLFGIGVALGSYSVLSREMAKNYSGGQPASATIDIENDSVPKSLLKDIKNTKGIKEVEQRSTVIAQMKVGNQWFRLLLFAIDDFNAIKISKITHESGAWPPPEGTMLVERAALSFMKSEIGRGITIKTPEEQEKKITISGTVFDPGMAPAWQDEQGYGYITSSTLKRIGIGKGITELKILVADSLNTNENKIKEKVLLVADKLEATGYGVHEIQIPPPGKHPHQRLMNTALVIFVLFGLMLLVLASILVSNAISTLMIKQVREIGVMKTIGASSAQISWLFAEMIVLLSAAATVIATISSPFVADVLTKKFSGGFNLNIYDATIPAWVFVVQVAGGIFIPLGVAAIPILKGGRITVREALSNYGVSKKHFSGNRIEKLIAKIHFLGQITTFSLRNIFRQPSRIILSIVLFAIGGSIFMTAINLSKSWDVISQKMYVNNKFDLELRMTEAIKGDTIINKIAHLKGVKKVEKWGFMSASVVASKEKYQISHSYPDRGHGITMLYGLPTPTEMVTFSIVEGRWLNNNGSNEIVLPTTNPNRKKVGDHITLSMEGQRSEWKVVGFYEQPMFNAIGYTSLRSLNKARHTEGSCNMLRISTQNRNTGTIIEIQNLLNKERFPVSTFSSIGRIIDIIEQHLVILADALIAMGILIALVGAIGLMSVISISILERTKELGVMRAIGATPQKITKLILGEGVILAFISLFFAVLLSIIASVFLGNYIGNFAVKTPLALVISPIGITGWTLIVIVASIIATLYPAWRANRLSVSETLAY